MKHTKGPWIIWKDTNGRLKVGPATNYTVAEMCQTPLEGQEANAKLIAAAPELLDALCRLELALDWYLGRSSFTQSKQLKGFDHSERVRAELFFSHDAARAAIAKATGETK